ncbi:hypothetical protein P4V43_17320 [Brevibacillus fortis]|nr:hypothetical protein [Brevibacillus fortis]MED1783581.1 hypothetical protein [Brevibacillus fortis]
MKVLFCSQPFQENKVDETYEYEYTCAKHLGLDISKRFQPELVE